MRLFQYSSHRRKPEYRRTSRRSNPHQLRSRGRFDKIFFIINSLNFGFYFYLAHHWIQKLIPKLQNLSSKRICLLEIGGLKKFRKIQDSYFQNQLQDPVRKIVVLKYFTFYQEEKGFWFVFVNFKLHKIKVNICQLQ